MSSRRRTTVAALLATILVALVPVVPAGAADADPDLRVTIESLAPSRLTPGSPVTVTGTVTNRDDHPWRAVQVYLVVPAAPFTTRAQVAEALDNPAAYTGVRVIETGTFDELGDLAAGASRSFRVRVPYSQLGVTGEQGVYPVGVQVLATDTDGARSGDALAKATTLLPRVSSRATPVPTSVVWPFVMPDRRDARGDYTEPARFAASVAAGGQLRNLLDLATATTGGGSTLLLDPALLVALDDLSEGRHLPPGVELTTEQQAAAGTFLADLLALARRQNPWVLDFDRPDDLALTQNPDLRAALDGAVDRATEATLTTFQLTGRRVSWPTRDGVTAALLRDLRGSGDSPVVVAPSAVPGWQPRLGALVQHQTAKGPVPLLVTSTADVGSGRASVVALRQRLLGDAALGVLERAIDPQSRADAVTMVDPAWDPGADAAAGRLSQAFEASFTQGTGLDALLTRDLGTYDGTVPTRASARPVARAQLESAAEVASQGRTLGSITASDDGIPASVARDVAGLLGVRWRRDRRDGALVAATRAREAGTELSRISVEGPPSVTLSSAKGGFPLTIVNDTGQAVTVGVSLDSSNPALRIPAVAPVEVAAGERRTLTVQVDLGRQRATFVTAHLTTPTGKRIGAMSTFTVRSSRIGAVLWAAMGAAGLLVLVALVRRFHRRRTGTDPVPFADDDD